MGRASGQRTQCIKIALGVASLTGDIWVWQKVSREGISCGRMRTHAGPTYVCTSELPSVSMSCGVLAQ